MERRDKALQAIKDLISTKNDEIKEIESEISGVKTETRREQDESEKLHNKLGAMQKDIETVQQAIQREEAEKKRLSEQYELLTKSL
jgi:septal ring factor EnvC (AmiA/AmiB activator)